MESIVNIHLLLYLMLASNVFFLPIKFFFIASKMEEIIEQLLWAGFDKKHTIECVTILVVNYSVTKLHRRGIGIRLINDMLKRLKVAQEIEEALGLYILVILLKQFPKLRQQWMLIRTWA
jgi:hypothetical protein